MKLELRNPFTFVFLNPMSSPVPLLCRSEEISQHYEHIRPQNRLRDVAPRCGFSRPLISSLVLPAKLTSSSEHGARPQRNEYRFSRSRLPAPPARNQPRA